MAAHRARTLPENCLYSVLPCCAHIVHLIIVGGPKAVSEVSVIGDVYAYEFVARSPVHHNNLLANLRKFIDENLVVIDDGREPSADDIRRVQDILEYTVARHLRHVRGRLPSCRPAVLGGLASRGGRTRRRRLLPSRSHLQRGPAPALPRPRSHPRHRAPVPGGAGGHGSGRSGPRWPDPLLFFIAAQREQVGVNDGLP